MWLFGEWLVGQKGPLPICLIPHIMNNIIDFQNSFAVLVYACNYHRCDKHHFLWKEIQSIPTTPAKYLQKNRTTYIPPR